MTTGLTSAPSRVVRRYVFLLVTLVALLGFTTTGFVLWSKTRSETSLRLADDFHLASAFHCAAARLEVNSLLTHLGFELSGVDDARQREIIGRDHTFNSGISFHILRRRTHGLLSLQASFGDPKFVSMTKRLARQLAVLENLRVEHLAQPGETSAQQTLVALQALGVTLFQLERLHTSLHDELLDTHKARELRDGFVLLAIVIFALVVGYKSMRRGLRAINAIAARQKENAELLQRNEERFRSAFENISVGSVVTNSKGTIEIFNASAKQIFGYEAREVMGQNLKILLTDIEQSDEDQEVLGALDTGKFNAIGTEREITGRRKSGETFPLLLGIGEMMVGNTRSFVASVVDLTEKKAIERQLQRSQRMEAVGQLTGGLAHDINNLLGIMLGHTELLENRFAENEGAKRHTAAVLRAINRAASLTARLLAFSRQQALSPVSADITVLLGGLEDMLGRTLGETIELTIETPSDLWPAMIDVHQFENALVNLAINARDAMPAGGSLRIEAFNASLDEESADQDAERRAGEYVKVAVSDTGDGIALDVLDRVFEPFFTTKEATDGSGLGLSMVYGFVKQSGGHITLDTEVGHGTTVYLYIPRSLDAAATGSKPKNIPEFPVGAGRILVVEDDDQLREVPASVLRQQGYEVVEAKDGVEAIRHLTGQPAIDLLFTDVVLPGALNGADVAREARRLQPRIKVIYTTGYADNAVVHDGKLGAGITMISKPYSRVTLLEEVHAVMVHSRPESDSGRAEHRL